MWFSCKDVQCRMKAQSFGVNPQTTNLGSFEAFLCNTAASALPSHTIICQPFLSRPHVVHVFVVEKFRVWASWDPVVLSIAHLVQTNFYFGVRPIVF